jgi:hypothetical protein
MVFYLKRDFFQAFRGAFLPTLFKYVKNAPRKAWKKSHLHLEHHDWQLGLLIFLFRLEIFQSFRLFAGDHTDKREDPG